MVASHYPTHVAERQKKAEIALAAAKLDSFVIQAGVPFTYYTDDMDAPFHPTPHFAHWTPLAGPFTLGGSILAAILLVTLPGVVSSASLTEWLPVVFGLGCIVFARSDNGVAGLVSAGTGERLAARVAWRVDRRRRSARPQPALHGEVVTA